MDTVGRAQWDLRIRIDRVFRDMVGSGGEELN